MLEVQRIAKAFGPTVALESLSFKIHSGEILGVVGENGSGKSTLMRVLCGELTPDSGQLLLDGKPYRAGDGQVFLVHQELALCPHMTVAENIFLGRMGAGLHSPSARNFQAREILDRLGYPDLKPDAIVGFLPISARQVVEIARAEAHQSSIILFDEPTSSLTKQDHAKLFSLLNRLKGQGKAVLFISHFLEEVREVCDRVIVLRDGALIADAPTPSLADAEIVSHMVGRTVSDLFPRSKRVKGEEMLRATEVGGQRRLPSAVNFRLHRGEVAGIAGLNGAGRTELLRCLMGLDPLEHGKVNFKGKSLNTIRMRWTSQVGMVSEDRKTEGLALALSITENLTMSSRPKFLYHPSTMDKSAAKWSERLNVKCREVGQPIADLSGGNQQKVAIARLLASDCDILLLDEPTRGIDVGSKAEIYRLIDQLACQGKAILVISSYLPELLGICDRIAVMNRGHLSEFQNAETSSQESLMEMCVR